MKIVSVNVSIPREVLLSGQIVTTGMQLIHRNTNNIIVKDIIRLYTHDDKNRDDTVRIKELPAVWRLHFRN